MVSNCRTEEQRSLKSHLVLSVKVKGNLEIVSTLSFDNTFYMLRHTITEY